MTWSLPKSAIGSRVARSKMVLRNFFCVAGDTWTVSQRQSAVHTSEITPSETATRGTLTPLARSAINSLSAESQEDCGEQSPRNGEDERERKDVSDKRE